MLFPERAIAGFTLLLLLNSTGCSMPILVQSEERGDEQEVLDPSERPPLVLGDEPVEDVPVEPEVPVQPTPVQPELPVEPEPVAITCAATGETYGTVPIPGPHLTPERDPDVNIRLRGRKEIEGLKELIDYPGETDPQAMPPNLSTIFNPSREPTIVGLFQIGVYQGLSHGLEGGPAGLPEAWGTVHLIAFATTPGEVLHAPRSGYTLAPDTGTIVVYADKDFLTLHYTPEDSIVRGYVFHLFEVCVDENLLASYHELDRSGRELLPGLGHNQPLGRAAGNRIIVGIRDSGSFMDPRAIRGWWRWPNG